MKKSYLMIAAAAALLAACSSKDAFKEVVNENETDLIGFSTYHGKATKAAVNAPVDLLLANGGFGVYGYKHSDNLKASNGTISMASNTSKVFDNVQVWYVDNNTLTQGFTYAVPKYWDKPKYYTFFAYAPYAAKAEGNTKGISFAEGTGLFTRNDVQSLQSTNATTTVTVGNNSRTKYTTANEASVVDYLVAPYVPSMKYGATNQPKGSTDYTGSNQTVGFTFYHIMSKFNVTVKAKDETYDATNNPTGHNYKGIKDIQINNLNIENLPNVSQDVTYTQTSVESTSGTVPTATFTPNKYSTVLEIVSGTNPLTAGPLYILDGGSESNGTITNPTDYIDQTFHYFIAPNTPQETTTGDGHGAYKLNIDYTVTYVDNTVEPYTRSIDLSKAANLSNNSATLTKMEQNNIYNVIVTIGLDQIYFTVDEVKPWITNTDTEVDL